MSDESQVPVTEASATPAAQTDMTLGTPVERVVAPAEPVEDALSSVSSEAVGEDVVEFAGDLHSYLLQNITWADAKAAFLFAGAGGLLAYLHNRGVTKKIMPALFEVPNTLGNTIGMIAVTGLLLAAGAALATFWPRTGGSAEGIVFWKAIATKFQTGHSFAETVLGRNGRSLTEAKLQHCWELARVCKQKFEWVNIATFGAAVGSAAAVIYVAWWSR